MQGFQFYRIRSDEWCYRKRFVIERKQFQSLRAGSIYFGDGYMRNYQFSTQKEIGGKRYTQAELINLFGKQHFTNSQVNTSVWWALNRHRLCIHRLQSNDWSLLPGIKSSTSHCGPLIPRPSCSVDEDRETFSQARPSNKRVQTM